MLLENISCPVCEKNGFSVIFKSKDFRFKNLKEIFNVVKCTSCDLIFLNPRPKESEFARLYPLSFYERERASLFKLIAPSFRMAQLLTIKLFKKYKKRGRALDIGCGNGNFVSLMQRNNYDAWGVEPNLVAKNFADRRLQGRILYKPIKECHFLPKDFDIVTMFQSLEHIYDLGGLFTEINRILKDDGLLYICVPNSVFFEARLFGPYYYNLEVPRHLYFFTKKSLKALLLKHGFKVTRLLKESLYEMVSTPASFYHGIWYLISDKGITVDNIIKSLTYIPLVMLRLIIRLLFFFEDQNLKILSSKV